MKAYNENQTVEYFLYKKWSCSFLASHKSSLHCSCLRYFTWQIQHSWVYLYTRAWIWSGMYLNNVIQYISSNIHPLTSRRSNAYQPFYTITDGQPNMAEAVYYTGSSNCCCIHIRTITSAISSEEACKRNVCMCVLYFVWTGVCRW